MLETTLPVPGGARTVRLTEQHGSLYADVVAGSASARVRETLRSEHMFRLDEDLSGFYALVSEDGELSWCARGAGGEPVDFARTIASHGVAELPPSRLDLEARVLETTLPRKTVGRRG